MRYVDFGRTGLKVAQLALGTGQLGAQNDGSIAAEKAYAIIGAYLAAGGNVIDTAERYQGGRSEELIGEFLGTRRDDVVLASKYSPPLIKDTSPAGADSHRKAMAQSVEGSLKRLRTDRIDIYLAHFDDGITPMEEIMRGFDELVSAGKVRYAGLSKFPAWRVARAATMAELSGWAPLTSLEVEYNLLQRTTEREILPLARSLEFGVLGYSPLAAGVLELNQRSSAQGKGAGSRNGIPTEANTEQVLSTLLAVAAELATDAAKIALAWVIAKGVVPILGVRTSAYLFDNLEAADLELAPEHVRRLDEASRINLGYPQALLAAVHQRT